MERERKFLVSRPPGGLNKFPHERIRQGYLAIPGPREPMHVEVRVREHGGKKVFTVKGGRGGSRSEVEVPIADDAFRSLWRLTDGRRIEKIRYRIPLGNLTVELDVYGGKLRGLQTAEVEFKSAGQFRSFRPPEWLGREVTGRDEFSNSRLATRNGPPKLS
ncbi:MAG TPA: CYTH domain-containing protein [Tepidisphaeraceae bacterium]|jgi:CYTH domain-containing protein|nr:CYTH domain-containing protein [Tepidisphaeraceae bacterium]